MDFGGRERSGGVVGAEEDVDLFEGAEEADEERGASVGRAAIAPEVAGAELAIAMDDGAAHGAVFMGALGPSLFLR
jgi:hypothetical protein